jgi:transposase
LTRTNYLFRFHEGSIKKEQIVEFLKALKMHLKQPLLIIWDGLKAHRSKLLREYLDSTDGHIQIAFLPPYAPNLNPIEYLWAWLKRHALANFCPDIALPRRLLAFLECDCAFGMNAAILQSPALR